MDIKRTGCILFIGLGIISFSFFLKGDKDIPYILEGEDIIRILEMESTNEMLVSNVQAIKESEEAAKVDLDRSILEIVNKNYIIDEERATPKEIEEIKKTEGKKEIEQKQDVIIAKNPVITPSRGNDSTDNRKDQVEAIPKFNRYVLDVIKTYPLGDKRYPYLLNNDFKNYNGVTEDLFYKGEILLKGNSSGDRASNCTGITFEVFFKAMQRKNQDLGLPIDDIKGLSKEQLMDFVLTWFVAKGDKSESNLAVAIEKYGLGKRIYDLEELRSGDFMDISRENNTGHAVIFMNWIRKDEKIIGFKYWSSQGSTKGISYKEEYFNIKDKNGKKYGNVIIDNLHLARVN